MRSSIVAAVAAVLGSASVLVAGPSITSGNASFSMPATASSLFPSASTSFANLIADTGGSDAMFTYNWGVKVPGVAGTRGLSASGGVTSESSVGDTYTWSITDGGAGPLGASRYNATVTIKITDGTLPGEVKLDSQLVFQSAATNTGSNTFQLFHTTDVELLGPSFDFSDDVFTILDAVVNGQVTDANGPVPLGLFNGINASRWQVSSGTSINGIINGSNIADLSNSNSFSGDGGYAFQWAATLAPGQSVTLRSSFQTIVPEPATIGLLALAAPALLRRRRA